MILESTFLSIPEMGKGLFPYLPISLLTTIQFNSEEKIADVGLPLLVIHSEEDELIPYTHGQKLFNMAQQPKYFTKIGGSHNYGFLLSEHQYVASIITFLTALGFSKDSST